MGILSLPIPVEEFDFLSSPQSAIAIQGGVVKHLVLVPSLDFIPSFEH